MNAVRSQQVGGTVSGSLASVPPHANLRGRAWDFWAIRVALVGASVALCYALRPFNLHAFPAAGLGFFIAMVVLLAELRLRHAEISGLAGGAIGLVVGLLASLLIALVVARTSEPETTSPSSNSPPRFRLAISAWPSARAKARTFRTSRCRTPLALPRLFRPRLRSPLFK